MNSNSWSESTLVIVKNLFSFICIFIFNVHFYLSCAFLSASPNIFKRTVLSKVGRIMACEYHENIYDNQDVTTESGSNDETS